MKTRHPLVLLLALLPLSLHGQEAPPPDLASEEIARSQACVPGLSLLAELEGELEPLARRGDRLHALTEAIILEDSVRVSPLDGEDPVERAVREWFVSDAELAQRYAEEEDEALRQRRREERGRVLARVGEALEEVSREAGERIEATEGVSEAVAHCDGVILVRSAVLEACEATESPVCEAARAEEPHPSFRFVDSPEMLWEIERMRPWTDPSRLHPSPEGLLDGARTSVASQRGNLTVVLVLEPILQPREDLPEDEAAWFDRNLEELGYEFDHPGYAMAPAISVRFEVPGRLAGENAYLLHFGDLSNPAEQVIHTLPAGVAGVPEATVPADRRVLDKLAEGEPVRLTAVRLRETDEGPAEADPLYTLELTTVLQAEAVSGLLAYWFDGEFASDLRSLVPPEPGEG